MKAKPILLVLLLILQLSMLWFIKSSRLHDNDGDSYESNEIKTKQPSQSENSVYELWKGKNVNV